MYWSAGLRTDSNAHATANLPIMLVSGGGGSDRGSRHMKYPSGTPLANLHLTLLDKMGVPTVERMGDSTGRLEHLPL